MGPRRRAALTTPTAPDVVQAVTSAVGSPALAGKTQIGALWSAHPDQSAAVGGERRLGASDRRTSSRLLAGIGDSWWQLANAGVLAVVMTQIAFLGHDAAHRQIFKSGRWNDWVSLIIANLLVGMSYGWWQSKHNRHHANPNKVGADPDIALTAIAFTPERATRHRSRLMRWLVAHQGWYFFPILLLEGLSLHKDGISRIISRDKIQRRWVEITFITFRLAGFAALVFLVLPPEKAVAFLAVQLAVFGLYMGSSFAPNHIGMPLVSAKLKLDFLRRQVLMSRNISGGPLISVFMGGLKLPDRAPPIPLHGATLPT
jgi:fatty acid desaturase